MYAVSSKSMRQVLKSTPIIHIHNILSPIVHFSHIANTVLREGPRRYILPNNANVQNITGFRNSEKKDFLYHFFYRKKKSYNIFKTRQIILGIAFDPHLLNYESIKIHRLNPPLLRLFSRIIGIFHK